MHIQPAQTKNIELITIFCCFSRIKFPNFLVYVLFKIEINDYCQGTTTPPPIDPILTSKLN